MSRESAELAAIAIGAPRRMRGAFRPWEKSKTRRSLAPARRSGAGFPGIGTMIARVFACTELARAMSERNNTVPDLGAEARRELRFRRTSAPEREHA
jgi:hypothetical protein